MAGQSDILVTYNLFINGYEYDYIASAHMRACSFVVFFWINFYYMLLCFKIWPIAMKFRTDNRIHHKNRSMHWFGRKRTSSEIRKSKTKAIGVRQDSLGCKYHIFSYFPKLMHRSVEYCFFKLSRA